MVFTLMNAFLRVLVFLMVLTRVSYGFCPNERDFEGFD